MPQPKTMKVFYAMLLTMLCALYTNHTFAQDASDVIVDQRAGERQLETAISVAANGDIYVAYNYLDSITGGGGYRVMKSTDRGFTWNMFAEKLVAGTGRITTVDVDVRQHGANYYKVFVSYVERSATGIYTANIQRYDAITAAADFVVFLRNHGTRRIYDLATSLDAQKIETLGTSMFAIGTIYSVQGTSSDSMYYAYNTGGGSATSVRMLLATTTSFFRNVDIGFGTSPAFPNGKFYFAWERLDDPNDLNGHIFVQRTGQFITSATSALPVCIDSLTPVTINKCRNPSIAAYHNSTDVNGTYPAMVAAQVDDANGLSKIYKFYNSAAPNSNNWVGTMTIINLPNAMVSPNMIFNRGFNKFELIYHDATAKRNHFITYHPSSSVLSLIPRLNNDTVLINPLPKIAADTFGVRMFSWIWQPTSAAGISLFDAEYRVVRTATTNDTICSNETGDFFGTTLNTSGTYIDTFQVSTGDSIFKLNLFVQPQNNFAFNQTICPGDTFIFNGLALSAAGTFSVTLPDRNGCDSVTTVTVLLLPAADVPVITATGSVLSTQTFDSYQWQLNGEDISGANSQTLTVFVSGNYTVRGTTANGCNATSQVFTHTISGIDNVLLQSVSIYPNPASNVLYIDGDYKAASVSITDIVGQQVLQSNVGTHAALNVEHLAAGTYIVTFSVEGKTASVKFNKQ